MAVSCESSSIVILFSKWRVRKAGNEDDNTKNGKKVSALIQPHHYDASVVEKKYKGRWMSLIFLLS